MFLVAYVMVMTEVNLNYLDPVCVFECKVTKYKVSSNQKIYQTKMLFTCQKFGDLFLFGLVWQYSTNQNQYNRGRFKFMATYLQQ